MSMQERELVRDAVTNYFGQIMDMADAAKIAAAIEEDVVSDVEECAHRYCWHTGDVCIAARRALFNRLSIEE